MNTILQDLRLAGGGILCGAAFMALALAISALF